MTNFLQSKPIWKVLEHCLLSWYIHKPVGKIIVPLDELLPTSIGAAYGTDAYNVLTSEPVCAPPPIPYPTATTDPHHPCYPQSTVLFGEIGNLSTTLEYEDFQECLEPSSSIGVQTEEQSCASLGIQTKGNGTWVTKAAARQEQTLERLVKESCKEACEKFAKRHEACIETLHEKIAMLTATIEEHKLAEASHCNREYPTTGDLSEKQCR